MKPARIATLLEPFFEPSLEQSLAPAQLNQISIYIDLLQRWNARINLTAIRTEEEIVTRHFGESLFLARHVFPRVERTLLPTKANTSEMPAPPISPTQCHPERSHVIREADAKAQSKDPYSTTKSGAKEDHHGSTAHRPP